MPQAFEHAGQQVFLGALARNPIACAGTNRFHRRGVVFAAGQNQYRPSTNAPIGFDLTENIQAIGVGELEVEKGPETDMNDLFAELEKQRVRVASLRNKANRLEEMFMHLVERKGDGA